MEEHLKLAAIVFIAALLAVIVNDKVVKNLLAPQTSPTMPTVAAK